MNNFNKEFEEYFEDDKALYILDNFEKIFIKDTDNEKEKKNMHILKKKLKKYIENSEEGKIKVKYYQKNNHGRYYPLNGIGQSSLKRKIRHTISKKYAKDLDIKNCSPSILFNLLKKENEKLESNEKFNFKNLENYLLNREKLLEELSINNNLKKEDAKMLYISVINNKYIPNEELLKYPDSFIKFYWELYHTRKKLIDLFKDLYEEVKKEKESDNTNDIDKNDYEFNEDNIENKNINENKCKNYAGSFMSRLIFDIENEILMNVLLVFFRRNIKIYGLQFDGLFFDRNANTDNLLEECHIEILNKMGYHILFDFKELNEGLEIKEEELDYYRNQIKLDKIINNNTNKKALKEILEQIDINDDTTILHYQTIIKGIFNSLKDLTSTFLYTKFWIKNSKFKKNDELLEKEINEILTNAENKDKNITINTLSKIAEKNKKEKEKEKKKVEKNITEDDLYLTNMNEEEINILNEIKLLKKDFTAAKLVKEKSDGRFVVALEKIGDNFNKTLYCFNDFYNWKENNKPLNRWYTGDTLLKIWLSEIMYKEFIEKFNSIKNKITNKIHKKALESFIDNLNDSDFKNKIVKSSMDILWDEHIVFNTSPLLFGFTDCIYELDTGIFRDYTKNDYVTYNCGWDWYNGDTEEENEKKIELIDNILNTIMPKKENKICYLDLLCSGLDGYAYQNMVFLYGKGQNSKSMMSDWIREDLGSYACKLPNSCIFEQPSTGPNPAMAQMNLVRFLHFSEPDPNKKADNGLFKEMTGGGVMNNRQAYSNKCKVILAGIIFCELNKYFKFKNLIGHAEKRRIICLLFENIFTDDPKLLSKGGIYKKKIDEYGTREFQIKHRKALLSILFKNYLDFYKNGRIFRISEDCITEKEKYLNINITLKKWIYDNYEFADNKLEEKEIIDINNNKIKRNVLIFTKIGDNDCLDGIFNKFLQSETYKNLLTKEDKVEYSNHLNFIKHLLDIEEIKNNYCQDKWVRINNEKIHLRNVIIKMREKTIVVTENINEIGTFENPEVWD